jgi:type IV pilus assembly protein PilC
MLSFHYTARNPATGEKISSIVQAETEQAAAKILRQQGLAPLDITLAKAGSQNILGRYRNRIKIKDKVIFSRQLSTLINAGLPLVQSLRHVSAQTKNTAFKVVINQIISDVEGGTAFAKALTKHPRVFSNVYVSLVAAGEASGTLDKALERLANQQEKDAEILSKVRSALVYPALVIAVMVGVVGFMILVVLPQVEELYNSLPGTQLPLITRIMLATSRFATHYWWAILLVFIVAIFATTRWARTGAGKQVIDKMKLKVWPLGSLFHKLYMARFARTGTTLVASGVPLIQMLEITANAINNVHIERSLHRATEKVKGGKSLADSIAGDPNFLELVPSMLKIGEESGAIESMLDKIADYYEREVDAEVKTISTIIEPVLMILLGIVAFAIVAAVLLPIYGLAGKSFIR